MLKHSLVVVRRELHYNSREVHSSPVFLPVLLRESYSLKHIFLTSLNSDVKIW